MKALSPILIILFLASCEPDNKVTPSTIEVNMNLRHLVDGELLKLDQLVYSNAIGQAFSIKTLNYFISGIKFHKADNSVIELPDIHYIDIRSAETLSFLLSQKVAPGDYTGISFVYGLSLEENITGRFTTPPESLMEWPVPMGGGYHYAKIEGQYLSEVNYFNFHTGMLDGIDYSIAVDLNTPFTLSNTEQHFNLNMEIQNWFTGPNDWDFEYYGPGIMGNHEAQKAVQENGVNVFSLSIDQSN